MAASEHGPAEFLDHIPGMTAVLDRHGRVAGASCRIIDYCGRTVEELRDWATNGTIHPDDVPRAIGALTNAIATKTPFEVEQRLRRFDGAYRWFRTSVSPSFDGQADVRCWYLLLTDIDDLKLAEHASRESERHLRLIIDAIPTVAWSARPDGHAEFFNQQYLDFLGLSLDEARENGWMAAVHPEDVSGLSDQWTRILASGAPGEAEARLRRHDGAYRWFHFRANPFRDKDGHIIKWYGVNTDIDDRNRAEQALRRSEMLRTEARFVETIPAMMWRGDAAGELEYLNHRAIEYLGHSAAQFSAARWLEAIHPDDREAAAARWRAAVETASPYADVYRLRRVDGQYRWLRSLGERFDDPDDQTTRWYGLLIDIDDWKRAEEELRRSAAFLAQAQRVTATGSLWWKVSTGQIIWSDESYRVMDYPTTVTPSVERIMERVHPEDRALVAETVDRMVRERSNMDIEHRLLMPDHSVKHVRVVIQHVGDHWEHPEFAGAVTDITERTRAEAELRQTHARLTEASHMAMIAELSASIAHEINQPLASVVTAGQACQTWLTNNPPNIERALTTLDRIVRDGHSAAEVVSRIRALFKQVPPAREPLAVAAVVEEVLRIIAVECGDDLLAVDTDVDPALVLADRVQIQQVLLNLMHNATESMVDVSEGDQRIAIRARRVGSDMLIEVSDQGCGLTDPSAVFDAFYTTKASGMGMGLAICRSIVEAHGGHLRASSNQGIGSTFSFTLPLAL